MVVIGYTNVIMERPVATVMDRPESLIKQPMNTKQPITNDFVANFRKSAPYIHAHRGKTFVVLFGGEAVDAIKQWLQFHGQPQSHLR